MKSDITNGFITEDKKNRAIEIYFKWKELNSLIASSNCRKLNIPEAVSEPLACWALGIYWNRGITKGDATSLDGKKVEIKASSSENDLTQFGPKAEFDDLVYARFDLTGDKLYIYDTGFDVEKINTIKVNKEQTVGEQKNMGRRPRFSLNEKIIQAYDLPPTRIIDLKTGGICLQ